MIEINLLPKELIKQAGAAAKSAKKTEGLIVSTQKLKMPAIITGAALLAIFLLLSVIVFLQTGRFNNLSSKLESYAPEVKKIKAITKTVNALKKEAAVINGLASRKFLWARKLNSLSDSMADNVWLTELELDREVKVIRKTSIPKASAAKGRRTRPKVIETKHLEETLLIKGSAISLEEEATAVIGKFMQNLQNNEIFSKHFEGIELSFITATKIEEFDSKKFVLRGYFKTEPPE